MESRNFRTSSVLQKDIRHGPRGENDLDCPTAGRHRELEKPESKKSEAVVQRALAVIKNFVNPFSIADKDRLYSLASGTPVSADTEKDVPMAETVGKAAKTDFISRLERGDPTSFFDSRKR